MSLETGLIQAEDGVQRCWWHGNDPEYLKYHDEEWGPPVKDDRRLFEKISLEGFQAGLSWLTILRKRNHFRQAFDNFEYQKIAVYGDDKIAALMLDAGIVRHRGKIEAVINNAQQMTDILKEFDSFSAYIWQFETPEKERPPLCDFQTLKEITMNAQSIALSKDLKKRGWKFVGSTTCYAFMQSMGMVNDHVVGCASRRNIEHLRMNFKRP